jgi:hypothetical protein
VLDSAKGNHADMKTRSTPSRNLTEIQLIDEWPEVEVFARHLRPLVRNKIIRGVKVRSVERVFCPCCQKAR